MAFSLTAIILAFVAPKHRIRCAKGQWRDIIAELEKRGEGRHEAGAFLLGVQDGEHRIVRDVVYYDELDRHAYSTGVCVLHGDAFSKLWSICRDKNLTVVADAHTHPGAAFQSNADRENPMVARQGHIAIIVPQYARWPIQTGALGIFEYAGDHVWHDRGGKHATSYFYRGFWA